MKKWIKGFCIAAIALICFGMIFCIGGVAAGGAMTATGIMKDIFERHGIYSTTIVTRDMRHKLEKDSEHLSVTKYPADVIRNLKIKTGAAEVIIMEGKSSDEFRVCANDRKVDVRVKEGTLVIERDSPSVHIGEGEKITLEIPEGFLFDEVDISIGAGVVEIGKLTAVEADFEIGAGEIIVRDGNIRRCDVEIGMGNFEYDGILCNGIIGTEVERAECNVDVGMGNAEFRLGGNPKDYNYRIDCEAGKVEIDGERYSGIGHEHHIDHHAESNFEIDCAMGTVTVEFKGGYTNEEIDEVL